MLTLVVQGIPDTREYYCGKKNTGKKTNDKKNEGEKTSKKADKKYQCVSDETPDQTQPTTGSLPTTLLRSTFASTVDEDEESPSNEGEDVTEATDPATTGTRFETLPTDDEDEESPSNEGQDVSESTEAATTGTEFETAPTDEDDESPGTEVSSTAFATTSTFFAGGSTSSTPFSVATVDADEDEESPSNEGTDVSAPVDEDVEESPSNEGVDRGGPAGGDPVVIGIPDLYYEDAYENYVEDEDEGESF